jgi:hypothetical protein
MPRHNAGLGNGMAVLRSLLALGRQRRDALSFLVTAADSLAGTPLDAANQAPSTASHPWHRLLGRLPG